jgi:hypothetical protein
MKALYIPVLPRNPELRTKQPHPAPVLGARVFGWTALCALLTYGTYDKYLVPGFNDQQRNELIADGLAPDSVDRLVPVPATNKWQTDHSDQLVLTTMGPELRTLATIRHRFQLSDAPLWVHTLDQFCANGIQHTPTILCRSVRIRSSPLFQQRRNKDHRDLPWKY